MFEVMWLEIDRNDRVSSKRKSFKTCAAMWRFIERLEEKGTFWKLLAVRDPA